MAILANVSLVYCSVSKLHNYFRLKKKYIWISASIQPFINHENENMWSYPSLYLDFSWALEEKKKMSPLFSHLFHLKTKSRHSFLFLFLFLFFLLFNVLITAVLICPSNVELWNRPCNLKSYKGIVKMNGKYSDYLTIKIFCKNVKNVLIANYQYLRKWKSSQIFYML